jgi:hypothetical protein
VAKAKADADAAAAKAKADADAAAAKAKADADAAAAKAKAEADAAAKAKADAKAEADAAAAAAKASADAEQSRSTSESESTAEASTATGGKAPQHSGKMTASTAIAWLKANYDDFKQLDLSNSFTLTPDQAIEIAAALETNTNLVELHLQSVRLTNQVATAFAKMLRVNRTLRILDLEDNKIDSDGIEEIGAALADNVGLIELTLFKNREPGEKALSVLIRSFDFNTTLQKINWRLTSRQSFALTKLLSRNVEILRRKEAGMDYSDIDPHCRREKDKELYASNSPALRRRREEDDGPQSGSSSPALQARTVAAD